MIYILLFVALIFISIISSILISKSEDKKDYSLKNKKMYGTIVEVKKSKKEEYRDYLKGDHWQEIRVKALDRAGYKCQLCSKREFLNVHHNTYARRGEEDLKDLVVLCRECHKKYHDIVS